MLHALRDAAEWHMITTVIDPPVGGGLLTDLQRAVGGSLVPRHGENLTPLQLQSQFFFGAFLVQDGHPLGAPTREGLPDFVFRDGLRYHGIEVKAPDSRRGLLAAVRKADKQLGRLSEGGLVVVDVSLLVQAQLGTWETGDGTDAWLQDQLGKIIKPHK